MPRFREYHDYFDSEGGGEAKHSFTLEIPVHDSCTDGYIDLGYADFVQVRKLDNVWQLVTSLPNVVTAQKKSRRQSK